MNIEWPAWWQIVNKRFVPLMTCEDRFVIMYGSRDSTKTSAAVRKLIYECLNEPYFKCIMVRLHYEKIRGSVYAEVKQTIIDLGLYDFFKFREQPYEITCKHNGNMFVGRGAQDVQSIKGVKEPTRIWYEEDIVYIPEDDWITIVTSMRSSKSRYLQDIYTINPEVEGMDFEENWFYKKFFAGRYPDKLSYRFVEEFEVMNETVELAATVHHSTWRNNRWIKPERVAFYKQLRSQNEYYGNIYVDGLWCNKTASGLFYYAFQKTKHIRAVKYDPNRPIHLTWDFNVRPYVSASIWQVYEAHENDEVNRIGQETSGTKVLPTVLVKVAEIASKPPRNRTGFACEEFTDRFRTHKDSVFIYGDPAGKHEDTRKEDGGDDFTIIMEKLSYFRPKKRVASSAPNVSMRGKFINNILAGNADVAILINPECTETIKDYTNGKEDKEGRKLKEKTKDEEGIPHEKYHHFTDGDDYFITRYLKDAFKKYLRGGKKRSYDPISTNSFAAR